MIKLKKTTMALFALSSGIAFAGTMGPVCAPGNVTVPCAKTAWTFGGQALYLQPSYSGLNFRSPFSTVAAASTTTPVGSVSNSQWQDVNPAWQWGFQLEGDYHFGMGKDLDINWYRVHNTNNSVRAANGVGTNGLIPSAALTNVNSAVSTNPQWDAVNVEFGQHVDFDEVSQMRMHAGVEYARIATKINTAITESTVAPITSPLATSSAMSYNGFGPRAGVDLSYGLSGVSSTLSGLNIYGKAATALLVGTRGFNTTVADAIGTAYVSGSNTAAIVPELEAKLGATYTYATSRGDLGLDVGWMWNNYFNAQRTASSAMGATNTGPTGVAILSHVNPISSDFALQGLYFGLKWTGDLMA